MTQRLAWLRERARQILLFLCLYHPYASSSLCLSVFFSPQDIYVSPDPMDRVTLLLNTLPKAVKVDEIYAYVCPPFL